MRVSWQKHVTGFDLFRVTLRFGFNLFRFCSIHFHFQLISAPRERSVVRHTFPEHRLFAWQVKCGAFSVSFSEVDKITACIKNQPEHHRVRTFHEEFWILLEKHRIKYDERYLWE